MRLTENQNKILSILQHGAGEEICYYYRFLVSDTGLDLETVKKEVQELKRLGLVEYVRGLMTEDGEVAGSGFTIPYGKIKELEPFLKH